MNDAADELSNLCDLISPMAIRVVATLRIADRIAKGADTLSELADQTFCDRDALGRLLRFLVVRGVFSEPTPERFELTEIGAMLCEDHPESMVRWLDLDGPIGRADLSFSVLLDVVGTGEPGYSAIYGRNFWDDLASKPALTTEFNTIMSFNREWAGPALTSMDWSNSSSVVDVGGGDGTLLVELLQAHPHLHGTVVEISATAAAAEERLARAGLKERSTVVSGNFFEALPADADVYLLNFIVHDWSDADAVVILRRCAEAAGSGGRVLLGELVANGHEDPKMFTGMDMRMLAYFGGRERTLDEYVALTRKAGLRVKSVTPALRGNSIIECEVE